MSQCSPVPEEAEDDLLEDDGDRLWWGGFLDDYDFEDRNR